MRPRGFSVCAALVATACVLLSACSSSGSGNASTSTGAGSGGGGGSSSSSSTAPSGGTIKIGYITDLTGPASSGFITSEKGVKAFVNAINAKGGVDGQKIEYIMADTATTPTGALTAAQKLVQNDHVFAIVENSSVFYGAEPYLLQNNIPVVGSAIDGPIWTDPKNTNLFAATGPTNSEYMWLAQGIYMKSQGATKCGSIAYAGSVSSANAAEGFVKSCQAAGLQPGYLNTQVPFGSTDVGPLALAIKSSGTDAFFLPTEPNTAFALVGALRQLGVKMKSILLATGYGGDLLESKAAIQAAQGVDFAPIGVPAEAHTPATQKRAAELKAVGVTGPPTFAEQEAFLTLTMFVTGLKAAGPNPTPDSFMTALRKVKNYNADGLYAPAKWNVADWTPKTGCLWVVRLEGTTFHLMKGAPICSGYKKFK